MLDFSGLRFDVSPSVPIPSSLIGLVIVSKADKTVQVLIAAKYTVACLCVSLCVYVDCYSRSMINEVYVRAFIGF